MNRKLAVFLFLDVCVILAILLLLRSIPPLLFGIVFAVSLVVLGILSRGFRK
jgi:hypothetical protein